MLEGALERGTTARIRERVLEQGAAERRIGHGTRNASVEPDDDVNQWVAFLPNKGKVFRTLINNARALETVRFILGEHAILSEFSAHVTWPGNREMPLHIDQWFMPHGGFPAGGHHHLLERALHPPVAELPIRTAPRGRGRAHRARTCADGVQGVGDLRHERRVRHGLGPSGQGQHG